MRVHSQGGHKSDLVNFVLRFNLPVATRVAVGEGAMSSVSQLLSQCEVGKRVLVLSQPPLKETCVAQVAADLKQAGYDVTLFEVPDGEACKSHEHLADIWHQLQKLGFSRTDTLLAVGGGALSDLGGFAASTYLRGINYVVCPTTLLAQVDASIGGKTGINLPGGKNLAGAFYFPVAVIADPSVLHTLPEREVRSGLGEIIKYAYIEDTIAEATDYRRGPRSMLSVLEDLILQNRFSIDNPMLPHVISMCIKMKLAVVGKDPHEGRLRRSLNLGHTFGHAVEKVTKYEIAHGEAVSIGLVFACELAQKLERFSSEQVTRLRTLLTAAGLPTDVPPSLDREALIAAMSLDKKKLGDKVKFVLPIEPIGRVDLDFDVEVDKLRELF